MSLIYSSIFSSSISYAGWGIKIGPIRITHNEPNPYDPVAEAAKALRVRELAQEAKRAAEKAAKAAIKIAQVQVNIIEAQVQIVTGDKESAKKAWKRAKNNSHEAIKNAGKAIESGVKVVYNLNVELPTLLTTSALDKTFGSNLTHSYKKRRKNISRETNKASGKIGDVLEVTIQPENLGKIAFIYAATIMGGPFGAALANVMYDKLILKKSMSHKDMLKSFAIGAAAGYAAQAAQGISVVRDAGYLTKTAASMAQNLTTDVGNIALSDESYNSRDF